MINYIFVFFTIFNSTLLWAKSIYEAPCGKYIFRVEITFKKNNQKRLTKLYTLKNGISKIFYTSPKGALLFNQCILNSTGETWMLFQEFHGLNDGPLDTYGIYDPKLNKLILNPREWLQGNEDEAHSLLGFFPPYAFGDRNQNFFCCSSDQIWLE